MCHPSSTCILSVRLSSGLFGHRLKNVWWSDALGRNPAVVSSRVIQLSIVISVITAAGVAGQADGESGILKQLSILSRYDDTVEIEYVLMTMRCQHSVFTISP